MSKPKGRHRAEYRFLKYPLSAYKRRFLNQWYYFKKPKLKKWWSETLEKALMLIVLFTNRRPK